MKLAKASPKEVEALLDLMHVLNSVSDGEFPCHPGGHRDDNDPNHFDAENPEHLRAFHDRVTACFRDHPGGLTRTVGGYHLAMAHDVFDPDAEVYDWHPSLKATVEARQSEPDGLPKPKEGFAFSVKPQTLSNEQDVIIVAETFGEMNHVFSHLSPGEELVQSECWSVRIHPQHRLGQNFSQPDPEP